MRWNKSPLIFLIFCFASLQAQETIWPGDVNNNGIVNGVDVLYVGSAYDAMGPMREGGNSDWEGQAINALWGQTFPDEVNYAYADCNGDGHVDDDDLDDVIKENFGFTHSSLKGDNYLNGIPGLAPPLILEPETTNAGPGTRLNVNLYLGTTNLPVDHFYGITFSMSYSAELIDEEAEAEEEGFVFELEEDSWIERGRRRDIEYLFHKNKDTGKAELAITRIDRQAIEQGSGIIGQFSIVVEDIIVGSGNDTFHIQIDSVFLIDDRLNVYPAVPDTAIIIIRNDASPTTGGKEPNLPLEVKVYPNPANDYFAIESKRTIENIRVFDAMGRPMPLNSKKNLADRHLIHTANWPSGLYYLELNTFNQTIIKKLAVLSSWP